ncbi:MAG: glutamate--cysteine ligase [Gammaproteobacteria bacterium]|nr:glutamate--cysteine ligase [Gammaproteobacteria bacterium]
MSGFGVDRAFERRLARLINSGVRAPLSGGLRGVEREALRVSAAGRAARSAHPPALGAALTHPHITTDYSEALIELVTPTFADSDALCAYLEDLHRFVYQHIGAELLWGMSMPCALAGEDDVPIARYGHSHAGLFRTVYRRGLRTRYGGLMQAIAGVHFNYSFSGGFWPLYAEVLEARTGGSGFVSARYFDLLRNFRRYGWIVPWLFGASPALDASFLEGRGGSGLEPLDRHTLVGRTATSLRMSTIGYRNRSGVAADVEVSVNGLPQYLAGLQHAMRTPHAPFAALGVRVAGEYQQLNANLLQIENEYYSSIRPKRAPASGEGTAHALARAGVEYVEVRALDVDPAFASGVSPVTLRLLEALLALCLLKDSPPIDAGEQAVLDRNFEQVAQHGRKPGLQLQRGGRATPLAAWATELLELLQGICELLDAGNAERPYTAALALQRERLLDPDLLPAARQLAALAAHGESFQQYGLRLAPEHRAALAHEPLSPERRGEFESEARTSLEAQQAIEVAEQGGFDDYLAARLERQSRFDCGDARLWGRGPGGRPDPCGPRCRVRTTGGQRRGPARAILVPCRSRRRRQPCLRRSNRPGVRGTKAAFQLRRKADPTSTEAGVLA